MADQTAYVTRPYLSPPPPGVPPAHPHPQHPREPRAKKDPTNLIAGAKVSLVCKTPTLSLFSVSPPLGGWNCSLFCLNYSLSSPPSPPMLLAQGSPR